MTRDYHVQELLKRALELRHFTYESIHYVELNEELVLVLVTGSHPTGRRYLGDVWSGTFQSFADFRWIELEEEVQGGQATTS